MKSLAIVEEMVVVSELLFLEKTDSQDWQDSNSAVDAAFLVVVDAAEAHAERAVDADAAFAEIATNVFVDFAVSAADHVDLTGFSAAVVVAEDDVVDWTYYSKT